MKILVVGSGGREHALVWKLKQSSRVKELYCAPGNGGIAQLAQCVNIAVDDIAGLLKFAQDLKIDLTIVGPEVPLALGIVDEFQKAGLKIFGPSRLASQLESSKAFAKEFMHRHHIPTPDYQIFESMKRANHFFKVLRETDFPLVIKADGLAAGKGVIICHSAQEARNVAVQILEEKVFQDAGKKILVEEYLKGQEVSILAISDGYDFVILESAQDHKRIFDDDLGPNTGGMGAYSPTPLITPDLYQKIGFHIIEPTLAGMRDEGMPFKGVLYAGLMLTEEGPKVLEYNVRLGDPEAQAVLPRLKSDLLEVILASCDGRLGTVRLEWDRRSCACVVMSSGGYPEKYEIGKEIFGLKSIQEGKDIVVFHAGTKDVEGRMLTTGGRVLGVTAWGESLEEAIRKAYAGVEKIKFEKCFFRRDIGAKVLGKVKV